LTVPVESWGGPTVRRACRNRLGRSQRAGEPQVGHGAVAGGPGHAHTYATSRPSAVDEEVGRWIRAQVGSGAAGLGEQVSVHSEDRYERRAPSCPASEREAAPATDGAQPPHEWVGREPRRLVRLPTPPHPTARPALPSRTGAV